MVCIFYVKFFVFIYGIVYLGSNALSKHAATDHQRESKRPDQNQAAQYAICRISEFYMKTLHDLYPGQIQKKEQKKHQTDHCLALPAEDERLTRIRNVFYLFSIFPAYFFLDFSLSTPFHDRFPRGLRSLILFPG